MPELAIHGGSKAAADLTLPEWPRLNDARQQYVGESLESERWCRITTDGDGFCDRLEMRFADYHDAKHAIAAPTGRSRSNPATR